MTLVWDVLYSDGPKKYTNNKAVFRAIVYIDDTSIKEIGYSMNRKGIVNMRPELEPILTERLKSQFLRSNMIVHKFIKVKSYDFSGK